MKFSQTQKPPLGSQINWAHPLAKGLVGCWLMNEGSGNKIYDLSGNGNVGTLINMDGSTGGWTPGRSGKALKFSGTDDYVDMGTNKIGSLLNTVTAISVAAWFNANDSVDGRIFSVIINAETTGVTVDVATGLRVGGRSVSTDSFQSKTITFPSLGTWHFVVGVLNIAGDSIEIYLDSISQGSSAVTFNNTSYTQGAPNQPDAIGAYTVPASPVYFNGLITDVRIYNRALSAQEVAQLYQSPYAMFEHRPVWMMYQAAGGLSIPVAMHHYQHKVRI